MDTIFILRLTYFENINTVKIIFGKNVFLENNKDIKKEAARLIGRQQGLVS